MMTITVTDKCYYLGKHIVNITGANTKPVMEELDSDYFDQDGTYLYLYASSREESQQLFKATKTNDYVMFDDKPDIYKVASPGMVDDIWLLELVPAEPKYDYMTQYVIDHVGSVDKIGDFRFWMPVELYRDMWFIKVNTGDYALVECRISTDEDGIDNHMLGYNRYDYKCRIVPVDESLPVSGRLMYADDLYSHFTSGAAMPVEDGDTLEYVDIERPLAGGFTERIEGFVVRNSEGEIKLTL